MAQRIPERRLPLLIAAAAQFGKQVRGNHSRKAAINKARLGEQQTIAVALIGRVEKQRTQFAVPGVVISWIKQLLRLIDSQRFRGANRFLNAKIVKRARRAHRDLNGAHPHHPRQRGVFQHKQETLLAARQFAGEGLDTARWIRAARRPASCGKEVMPTPARAARRTMSSRSFSRTGRNSITGRPPG